ncbi:hypothetical protein evm_014002 [Chilo suppressalis]|nr:hypothetical protein evm_014002 [Chilo suppressalis]
MDSDFTRNEYPALPLDTEPASDVDHGATLDSESATNDNLGINLDSPPNLIPSSENEEHMRCINCGVDLLQRRRRSLELIEVLSVIRQWTAPQTVTSHDLVCYTCWMLALNTTPLQEDIPSTSSGHSRQLCVNCGRSILRIRSHLLQSTSERELHIRNVISEWISPRQVRGSDRICHPCWQRADRVPVRANIPEPINSINLPNYTRAPDTQAHCFCPDCDSPQRLTIPTWLRVKLFIDFNFYIPKNNRICSFHLHNNDWAECLSNMQPNHEFTAEHIQDFASFIKERNQTIDFNNIDGLSEDMVHFWLGLSKQQFAQIKVDLPRLCGMRNGELALIGYLIKLRTGDSDERISTLLNIPRSSLTKLLGTAREILNEEFIPRNLGIHHISRSEISDRNLIIPNGLFGGEDRKPIILIDGTYLYVQKSSNYLYQKNT